MTLSNIWYSEMFNNTSSWLTRTSSKEFLTKQKTRECNTWTFRITRVTKWLRFRLTWTKSAGRPHKLSKAICFFIWMCSLRSLFSSSWPLTQMIRFTTEVATLKVKTNKLITLKPSQSMPQLVSSWSLSLSRSKNTAAFQIKSHILLLSRWLTRFIM